MKKKKTLCFLGVSLSDIKKRAHVHNIIIEKKIVWNNRVSMCIHTHTGKNIRECICYIREKKASVKSARARTMHLEARTVSDIIGD